METNVTRNKELINVSENPFALYEWCRDNKFFDDGEETFDDWFNKGEDLTFFEGDPDMIKIGDNIGYFFDDGDKVFYYFFNEDCYEMAEKLISGYCNAFEFHITIGGESYRTGSMPKGMGRSVKQSWDTWKLLEYGIAWRGGAGYCYDIIDCEEYVNDVILAN